MLLALETDIGRVTFHLDDRNGRVTWMSHWESCDALVTAGLLRRENYGPATYGHCDYFLATYGQREE